MSSEKQSENFILNIERKHEITDQKSHNRKGKALTIIGIIGCVAVILMTSFSKSETLQQSTYFITEATPLTLETNVLEVHDRHHSQQLQQGAVAFILDKAIDTVLGTVQDSVISAILGIFFPPAELDYDLIWKNIKERVENLCKDLISQEYAYQLELRLQGLKNDLQLYDQTSFGSPQKGQYMTNLLNYIAESEPYFMDNRSPEKTMAYFTQMGTISLGVHREQVVNYRKIYGQEDIDESKHIQNLKDKIATYTQAGSTMYQTAVDWRSKLIRFEKEEQGLIIKTTFFYYIDDKTSSKEQLGYCCGDYSITEEQARQAFESKKTNVMNAFRAELDLIVLPSQKWQYFDSTKYPIPYQPEKQMQFINSGPFGKGISYDQSDFNDLDYFKANGAPSKIIIRSGGRIEGLQFHYGGIEAPIHGGATNKYNEINLGGDQKIIKVSVRAGQALDGIGFWTNAGGQYSYGGSGGQYYEIPAPVDGAYLAAIYGKQGSRSIEAITFVWVYYA